MDGVFEVDHISQHLAVFSPNLPCLEINIGLGKMFTHTVKQGFCYNWKRLIFVPLCLNTLIAAPDNLAPKTNEEWFSSSLKIKQP